MAEALELHGRPIKERSSYSYVPESEELMVRPGPPGPEGGAPHSPAIDTLVQLFYKREFRAEVGLTVSEVFKGGSLGQGTQVKHKYDIDLIIYSRGLREEEPVVSPELFQKIVTFLRKHCKGVTKYEYRKPWYNRRRVTMGITFTYPLSDDATIEVDLSLSPFFPDLHHLLTSIRMADKKERKWFSASKWQTDFIAQQDQWVSEFCRRIKAWRDLQWDDKQALAGCPKSYFLSVLVVIVYDGMPDHMKQKRSGNQGEMKKLIPLMTEGFKALIRKIDTEGQSLDLIVPVPEPYTNIRETYKDLLPPCPRIVDPVNPSKNLYHSGIYGVEQGRTKWASFIEKIDTLDLSPNIEKLHEERFKP